MQLLERTTRRRWQALALCLLDALQREIKGRDKRFFENMPTRDNSRCVTERTAQRLLTWHTKQPLGKHDA
jgi:hypothetical protein